MLYSLVCLDTPEGLEIRKVRRPDHVAYLEKHADQIVYGGPLLAADGETPIGSLLIVDVADQAAAEAFSRDDPYNQAGVFGEVSIRPTRQVFPKT